jgi:hypothetical protein
MRVRAGRALGNQSHGDQQRHQQEANWDHGLRQDQGNIGGLAPLI